MLVFSADARATCYKVSGKPVQAVLEPADMPRGSGVVRLADVTLIWCGDGTCCGGAVFDLEPGGAGECPLNLPKGYELIQVSVDGLAVAPRGGGAKLAFSVGFATVAPARRRAFSRAAAGDGSDQSPELRGPRVRQPAGSANAVDRRRAIFAAGERARRRARRQRGSRKWRG